MCVPRESAPPPSPRCLPLSPLFRYYFAIPPNVFLDTAASIKQVGLSKTGFTRLVVEKREYGRVRSQSACLFSLAPSTLAIPLLLVPGFLSVSASSLLVRSPARHRPRHRLFPHGFSLIPCNSVRPRLRLGSEGQVSVQWAQRNMYSVVGPKRVTLETLHLLTSMLYLPNFSTGGVKHSDQRNKPE